MDKYPISVSSFEKFYYVDGHQLEEITLDLPSSMRIDFRWDAIREENGLMAESRAARTRGGWR